MKSFVKLLCVFSCGQLISKFEKNINDDFSLPNSVHGSMIKWFLASCNKIIIMTMIYAKNHLSFDTKVWQT